MTNIEKFEKITQAMLEIYKVKNANYGSSFDKSLDEDGLIVSKIRIGDKFNRFVSLLKKDSMGTVDESIYDTLLDLANYAILTIMWLENKEEESSTSPKIEDSASKKSKIVGGSKPPIINKVGFVQNILNKTLWKKK